MKFALASPAAYDRAWTDRLTLVERVGLVAFPDLSRHAGRAVRALVDAGGSCERTQLTRDLVVSRPTMMSILAELRGLGLIDVAEGQRPDSPDVENPAATRGRLSTVVRMSPRAGVVVAIDIGHRHLRIALVDATGSVLAVVHVGAEQPQDARAGPRGRIDVQLHAVDVDATGPPILALAMTELDRLLDRTGLSLGHVHAIALGMPAPLDRAHGRVAFRNFLRGWATIDIRAALAEGLCQQFAISGGQALSIPVVLENDANLAAVGEFYARRRAGQRDLHDLLFLKLSTGVGSGLILDGNLFSGSIGVAGEIGHMAVPRSWEDPAFVEHVQRNPLVRCARCGHVDCLEVMAGGAAVLAEIRCASGGADGSNALTLEQVVADAGDPFGPPVYRRAVVNAAEKIGATLGQVAWMIDPGLVVLGGVLGGAGNLLAENVHDSIRRHSLRHDIAVECVPRSRLYEIAIDGGAALAWREAVSRLDASPDRSRLGDVSGVVPLPETTVSL